MKRTVTLTGVTILLWGIVTGMNVSQDTKAGYAIAALGLLNAILSIISLRKSVDKK